MFLIFLAVIETSLMSVKVFVVLSQNRPCPVFKSISAILESTQWFIDYDTKGDLFCFLFLFVFFFVFFLFFVFVFFLLLLNMLLVLPMSYKTKRCIVEFLVSACQIWPALWKKSEKNGAFTVELISCVQYCSDPDHTLPRESKKIVQELQMSLTLIQSLNHRFVVVLMKKT